MKGSVQQEAFPSPTISRMASAVWVKLRRGLVEGLHTSADSSTLL